MSKWIKTSDQLPSLKTPVIVKIKNDSDLKIGYLYYENKWADKHGDTYLFLSNFSDVAHWQPLPPLPENEL